MILRFDYDNEAGWFYCHESGLRVIVDRCSADADTVSKTEEDEDE